MLRLGPLQRLTAEKEGFCRQHVQVNRCVSAPNSNVTGVWFMLPCSSKKKIPPFFRAKVKVNHSVRWNHSQLVPFAYLFCLYLHYYTMLQSIRRIEITFLSPLFSPRLLFFSLLAITLLWGGKKYKKGRKPKAYLGTLTFFLYYQVLCQGITVPVFSVTLAEQKRWTEQFLGPLFTNHILEFLGYV